MRAAVLGRPIAHSLSPVLHRAAYSALGLDWTYESIDCAAEELRGVLAVRRDWAGFSCTMPLKHAVLDVAESATPLARAVGSGNTLLRRGDGWLADNTDVVGILAALSEHHVTASGWTILGAGGTAQAALAAARELGIDTCAVLVRDPNRARVLLDTAERLGVRVDLDELAPDAPALGADVVISTLPAGAADVVAERRWRAEQAVLDVVYAPWPTVLAGCARDGAATVVSGALMLLHQAAAQVTAMTGQPAPVDAMRAALLAAVPGCGA